MKLKNHQEIEYMKEGGHKLSAILDALVSAVRPGMATKELDTLARKLTKENDAKPSFLNYNGFPMALCVSINEEIVHGLPSDRKLKDGDLVKIDYGILYKGFHTDSARSVVVGLGEHKLARSLISVATEALELGIKMAQSGNTTGDLGLAIHEYVKSNGFDVVRDLVGHGIGSEVHEAPEVPNYGKSGDGIVLKPGMVIAIEPMVVAGTFKIAEGSDGFAYITADKKLSAHVEHTVAITKDGPVVLTK